MSEGVAHGGWWVDHYQTKCTLSGIDYRVLVPSLQMCFLKGRVTEKHSDSHKMVEFSSISKGQKGWHHRLVGSNKVKGGRVWDELKAAFVYSPRNSVVR
jgi:hypothetical protein